MSKAILLSIKPEWLAKILNGEKTIEVRKLFPKDYVGWVYLYCSRNGFLLFEEENSFRDNGKEYGLYAKKIDISEKEKHGYKYLNGKVVARFWCDKVEGIYWKQEALNPYINDEYELVTNSLSSFDLLNQSCLNETRLIDYLDKDCEGWNVGFAIHISKLEIFDKPKELREFRKIGKHCKYQGRDTYCDYCSHCDCIGDELTKAPQNYCYIE